MGDLFIYLFSFKTQNSDTKSLEINSQKDQGTLYFFGFTSIYLTPVPEWI